ncbi:MAG: hypothetical protein MUP98_16835 [Candidatus Aminicenantes bacterium]|nr:hypothetical protein [Candidatus Aminicenantes bacterium]
MMEKSVWRTSGHGSSPGGERGRKSSEFFSLGKTKRDFESTYQFTELVLEITVLEMISRCTYPVESNGHLCFHAYT